MRMGARGVVTLTVVGRRTGEPRKVPVIPVEVGQGRYLVSPYGESDWVRNLRAAGQGELSSKGQTEVSPTTSPDPYSRPADSGRDYTLDRDTSPFVAAVRGLLHHRPRQQRRPPSRHGIIELLRRIARGFRNPARLPTADDPRRREAHPPESPMSHLASYGTPAPWPRGGH
jgi:hypothetical protein